MVELNYYWVKDEEGEEIDEDTLYLAHDEQEAIEVCISKWVAKGHNIYGNPAGYVAEKEEDVDDLWASMHNAPSLRAKEYRDKVENIVTPIWNNLSSEEKEDFWKQVNEDVFLHVFRAFLHGKTWQEDEGRLIANISALIIFDLNMENFTSWKEIKEAVDKRIGEICEPFSSLKVEDFNRHIKTQLQKLNS